MAVLTARQALTQVIQAMEPGSSLTFGLCHEVTTRLNRTAQSVHVKLAADDLWGAWCYRWMDAKGLADRVYLGEAGVWTDSRRACLAAAKLVFV